MTIGRLRKMFSQYSFRLLAVAVLCVLLISAYFRNETGASASDSSSRNIVIGFFTYNGYGNNLYLDNVRTGIQVNYDVKVTALINLPYDTIYSVYRSGTDTITPVVGISNIGRLSSPDSIKVFLKIDPIGYLDSVSLAPLSSGQSAAVTLDRITYPIGTGLGITAYCRQSLDSNNVNDTLWQYTIVLPGFRRNVLFEEFTSNSSPACANNNSFLNAFVNNNFDSVCAIKYHLGVLGTDSFYLANPVDADARKRYYYAASVPQTIADGKTYISIPYGDSVNLYVPYANRQKSGTPLEVNVADEVISPGVIRSTATVNIISALGPGNYRIRFNAVERYRQQEQQGTNGETNFYDIFRDVYPDTNGIPISTAPGTAQYSVTYSVEPGWQDSMIYTTAFIQNDMNREVLNCGKSRSEVISRTYDVPKGHSPKADLFDAGGSLTRTVLSGADTVQSNLTAEVFEAFFPPIGWHVFNQDGYITFDQFTGANGPSIGGVKSVIMDFFDYNIPGQRDSMYSTVFRNLNIWDTVRFDYAYAQFNAVNIDSLVVKISPDGGLTFPFEIFRKGGLALATAPQTSSYFVPQNNTEWRSYSFPLSGIVSVADNGLAVPGTFKLHQNYPNPFNPSTTIMFSLPVRTALTLKLYDTSGRLVRQIAQGVYEPGEHSVLFSAEGLASGIYFCSLNSGAFASTVKIVLAK